MDVGSYIGRFFACVVPILLLIMVDQLTKYWALFYLKDGLSVAVIPEILYFEYVENTGVAFGLFSGHKIIFIIISLLVSILLFVYAMKIPRERRFIPLRICLGCIIAGAIGNVIDRIRYGHVIDFIYFRPIDFPVFNFADICVTVSVATVIFLFIFFYTDSDIKILENFNKTKNDG